MGQALYRTYRSKSLSEVVGQEHITDTLARAVHAGRVSHAYLFTGPRGVGKTSVARILAHVINDLPYSDAPHLDIVEIDAASNRRIDDIRDLREKIFISPVSAQYKVYIIDEVHMLTGESFNALLKTLEEPPAHVVFILATTEVHKLPATIISRTQRFTFKPGSPEKMLAHLKMVAKKEGIVIEDEALTLIAEHGEGSFRDSLSLLDQITHVTTGPVTAQHVTEALGLAPKHHVTALSEALLNGDVNAIMTTFTTLEQQGCHIASLIDQLTKELLDRAAQQPQLLALIDTLLEVPRAYRPSLKLMTVLARFAAEIKRPAKTSAALVTAPQVLTIAALPKPPKSASSAPTTESVPAGRAQPLTQLDPQDWTKILEATKRKSPPIYSVLKQAHPSVADGQLVLTFTFALHGKKLDDPKQKAFVAAVYQEILGISPLIKVVAGVKKQPEPASGHIANVTAIMGGGEVINDATI